MKINYNIFELWGSYAGAITLIIPFVLGSIARSVEYGTNIITLKLAVGGILVGLIGFLIGGLVHNFLKLIWEIFKENHA